MDNSKEQEAHRQQQRQLFQQGEVQQFSASRVHKPTSKTAEQELQEAQAAQAVRAFQATQQHHQQHHPQHQQSQQTQSQPQQQQQAQPGRDLAVAQGNFARLNAYRQAQGQAPLSLNAYCRQMRIPTTTFGPAPTFNENIWTENRRDQRASIERSVSPTTRAEGDRAMTEEEFAKAQRRKVISMVKKGSDTGRRNNEKKPS